MLLVDDEPGLLSALADILTEYGYIVISARQGEDAVEIASLYQPNVLISDFRLPGIDGVTTIHEVRAAAPQARAILMSGYISCATRQRAVSERVDGILEKPVSVTQLLKELRSLPEERKQEKREKTPRNGNQAVSLRPASIRAN